MTSDLEIDVIFINLIKLDHKKIKFERYGKIIYSFFIMDKGMILQLFQIVILFIMKIL